jgi:hypothetical protein
MENQNRLIVKARVTPAGTWEVILAAMAILEEVDGKARPRRDQPVDLTVSASKAY